MFWSLGHLALRWLLQIVLLRLRSEGFREPAAASSRSRPRQLSVRYFRTMQRLQTPATWRVSKAGATGLEPATSGVDRPAFFRATETTAERITRRSQVQILPPLFKEAPKMGPLLSGHITEIREGVR